jgi:hypothetical protein
LWPRTSDRYGSRPYPVSQIGSLHATRRIGTTAISTADQLPLSSADNQLTEGFGMADSARTLLIDDPLPCKYASKCTIQ